MGFEIKQRQPFSVSLNSEKFLKLINNTLKDQKTAIKFISNISSVVANNPKLQECDHSSIISAGLASIEINLSMSPSLSLVYLVPYKGFAQFQIGYKGLIQLAMRTNIYKSIGVIEVRKGEYKGLDMNGEPIIEFISDIDEREKAEVIGYRAYFTLLNGFQKAIYMSVKSIEAHAEKYSKSYKSTSATNLWRDQFDIMAKKTILKKLIRTYGVMSIELEKAMAYDQAVLDSSFTPNYIDNEPLEPQKRQIGVISPTEENNAVESLELKGDLEPSIAN